MRIKIFIILVLLTILNIHLLRASEKNFSENTIADAWCADRGGARARFYEYKRYVAEADCLTKKYAIEAEMASRWHQSIGQSLWYAYLWHRKPAILLIVTSMKDEKYLIRLKKTLAGREPPIHYGITGQLNIRVFVKRLY